MTPVIRLLHLSVYATSQARIDATTSVVGMAKTGVYPGSFNPPTTAHLAIARAARDHYGLDTIDLTISVTALAKETVSKPILKDRLDVLFSSIADEPWLRAVVTEQQLLADIAEDYDVLVLGADKWLQIQDPKWYGTSNAARDEALARLPDLAIAPRGEIETPAEYTLEVDDSIASVSSTNARNGDFDLMLPAARLFAERTGAWLDPDRYERWLETAYGD